MLKSEAAAYLAGVTQTEGAEASAPTNLHVITGEVGEASADGKTLVKIDGLMFSESDDQFIEVDALGGLEEGDIATIVLTGEQGHAMTPLALGSIGSVDRITVRIAAIEADYIKVEQLDAAEARIGELEADHVSVDDLNAATARIGTLETTRATITDLEAAAARIGDLEADHVSTDDLDAATARIGTLETNTADIGTIRANSAKVQNLTAAELEADHAAIEALDSNYAHITNGVIDNATIGYADVNNLSAHYAEIQNGKINSALIDTAAIVDEQVFTVTGNKATLAQIDASKINVLNLKAKDIEVERINGQPVTNKTLVDALSQHETDISDLDTKIDNEVEALNDRIDGAIETFTGTVVPTLDNTPASSWNTTKLKDQHVGDVYYVVNSQSAQNGYCYRFTKSGSTYSWQLIKDSDVTAALSRLQTAEGKIGDIEQFDETVGSFMTDTDEELSSLKTKTTSLETSLGDKVDKSTFNTVSQKVDTNEANITSMSTVLTNNGLTSSTNITNTVNSVKQTADTNKASITSLTQTVNNKADGSTVTTLTQRTSTIEQNLNGITTRVSATESSISGHPDCWRIDRYSRPARVNTNNVVPVPDDFVEENFLDTRYRKESDMGTNLQIADHYIAKLTTYVHATEATTITDNFQHDDASAVYLNDEHIAEAAGTTVISVTLNLRAGWNKIRFLLNEQTGSDYARFATRISTWSNVDQQVADLNEYEGTIQEQRLSSAETSIEQNAEAITLRATKTEVQQVRPAYASSSTAAGTAAKVATIDPAVTGYALYKGASVAVTFSTANTAATPTLNLNSTGAKQIRSYTGAALSEAEYKWAAGSTIDLVYDGTYWRMQDSGAVKRVTAAEASISINAENIESKVSKDGVISSINQSAESVKIQASKVEIDGTAIFTAISSDVDDAITDKGYATTTQAQGYATTAKTEAVNAAAADATSKANAAEAAAKAAIPSDISELNNDTGFITSADVPTKVSELTNDSGFQNATQVNTAITSKGYQTSSQVESAITSKGYATTTQAQGYADAVQSNLNASRAWYAECSTAAATVAKVATITPATTAFTLTNGVVVNVKFSVTNTGSAGSLTLNVNGTGAKSIKTQRSNSLTNLGHAGVLYQNAVIPFVYNGQYWLAIENYNSDTYNRVCWQNVVTILEKPTGTWRILCGTSSGYKQVKAGVSFDLAYPLLAFSNQPEANTTADTGYLSINSLTFSNTASIQSGAAGKTIFLKGTVSGNTFTIDSTNVFTTVAPTSEDGAFYIPLGIMTSATAGYFESSKNLYAYLDGRFRQVTPTEIIVSQRIYYRSKVSGTVPKPTAWVTLATNKYNDTVSVGNSGWSTKVTPIAASTAENVTKYLYLYTCEQRKRLDGTIECTAVTLDENTTIIDGGNVITHTITAEQIDAASINASKTLTVGAMTDAAASTILNSNVPQYRVVTTSYSYTLAQWLTWAAEGYTGSWSTGTSGQGVRAGDTVMLKGINKDNGSAVYVLMMVNTLNSSGAISSATSHGLIDPTAGQRADLIQVGGRNLLKANDALITPTLYNAYDLYVTDPIESGQPYVLQLWDVDVSHSAKTAAQLGVNVYYCGGSMALGGWVGTNYFASGHADHLTLYFTVYTSGSTVNSGGNISGSANVLSHSSVTNTTKKYIRLYNSVPAVDGTRNMSVGSWKLEKGNKPTDWSPAPEDMATSSSVDQTYVQNLTPYFQMDMTKTSDEYWANLTYGRFNRLGDGWAHFEYTNSGSSTINNYIKPKVLDFLEPGGKYTLLVEFKNVSISKDGGSFYSQQGDDVQVWGDKSYCGFAITNAEIRALSGGAGTFYKTLTLLTADSKDPSGTVRGSLPKTSFMSINQQVQAGQTVSYDLRLSLYEDGYTGPYKPYSGDQLYATNTALAGTNESLEGAITDIGELSDQLVDTTTEQNKTITDIQKYLNSLRQDLDAEIQSRQQWLNFNAAEGLIIGAAGSTFKTVTTNTSQQFRSGGTVLAETSGSEFVAPVMRSDQILIGNWMWTRRDNGNLSLKWIG